MNRQKTLRAGEQRMEQVVLEKLKQVMLDDGSVSGATLIMPDGNPVYVSRNDLLRQRPERSDG